jgi:hypothetical protein
VNQIGVYFNSSPFVPELRTVFRLPPHASLRQLLLSILAAGLILIPCAVPNRVCEATGAAHPISITEVQMFVTRSKAILRVQMFAEDLILFQGLEPNDQDRLIPEDLKRGLEDHKAFLLEKISLRDANGELYKGQITDMKPFEIPADGIAATDMMQHTATYEIEVPFATPPEFLTIQQDITDANSIVPSEMSLNIHQAGTGLNFTERLLPGGSTTVRFDWKQELAEDASDEEWDSWFEKQREATLGITSYSSVYSFIYIEPVEMRHEILIPLATLATILPIKHQDPAFVEIGEQDAIREQIRNWLKDQNPVVINGTRITPEFTRIDFYSLNLSDFAAQAAAQKVSMASGRVGIIMTYKTPDDSIRDVSQSWSTFYSTMTKVPAVVIAYPNSMSKFEFSRFNTVEDNTLTWKCKPEDLPKQISSVDAVYSPKPTMRLLAGSVVLGAAVLVLLKKTSATVGRIAAGLLLMVAVLAWKPLSVVIDHPWKSPEELSTDQAKDVFTALHSGLYRSLDFGTEDRIYDALAQTVDGELLEDLYLQLRQSLELRDQGGAIARIRSVEYDAGSTVARKESVVPWPGFQYKSTWTVSGTVEHWGHVHERQNQFDAVFTIEPREGHWKITRMDVAGQTQKSARTTLRKF